MTRSELALQLRVQLLSMLAPDGRCGACLRGRRRCEVAYR
jgi:hypothetical protein